MKIVDSISIKELKEMAQNMYGNIVKADVDIAKNILIVDMGMHADGEAELLAKGSKQEDIWGINLHPDKYGPGGFIEYDSMINIKPRQNNPSRDILDEDIKVKIYEIVFQKVHE